jgi:tetratricopeptide (TPR) repeat protein
MIRFHFFASVLFLFIIGCSPKSTEPIPKEKPAAPEIIQKSDPNTPCTTLDQLSGYIKEEIQTAFVLYRDQIKYKNPEKAYPLWTKAFHGAPGGNGKITYHFDDGIAIFKHFYDKESDPVKKKSFFDSINMVYNKRAECFGDEDYLAGRKAFDYYYTFSEYVDENEIFNLFKQNLTNKGDSADYFIINPFTKMLFDRILQEEISLKEGLKFAKQILSTIDYGKANCKGRNCEAWEIISEYAPVRLEALEGVDGFWDCAYYSSKYYPMYLAAPDDCETIELVYRRLLRGQCAQDSPELRAIKAAKENKCYTPPPPAGPLQQAFDAYNNGDYRNAIELFKNFVELTDDTEKKAKYLLLIAKIYYRDMKDYPSARKYAMRAAGMKGNWGEPYMLIGKLYASSGPLCGPGRGWDSQIVTWPAIDKFQHAKNIDPAVASEANQLINQYRQYMPKREDIFFRQLNAGDTFRVPCWIQESTTIRTAD